VKPQTQGPAKVPLRPAGFGRRLGAFLIDLLVCGVPAALLAWLWYRGQDVEPTPSTNPDSLARGFDSMFDDLEAFFTLVGAILLGSVLALALYGIYSVVLNATTGQTLGKKALGIRVVKSDGRACDWPAALKRALIFPLGGSLIASLLGFLGVGVGVPLQFVISFANGVWPLFNKHRESLGDKLAGTRVVQNPTFPVPLPDPSP
jgi:uncharacterized RDD family membrane protein YckC